VRAIAERYLKIPCACMTPNNLRLTELDKLIAKYKPDAVVDVVLHACHSYNIESFKLKEHVVSNHGLQYIKIETDYSQNDYGQISTRVEALLEKSAYSVR
jgi:benzoyl-CoA reductase/2-hydroxyglutaryl-CoA dehydratase subunit BcrC/BadD/HgdB